MLLDRSLTVAARIVLLALAFSPGLRAQFTSGGTGVLGDFINPLSVTSLSSQICSYDLIQIDLAQGKVFARPWRTTSQGGCNTALVDITALAFPSPTITLPVPFPDGLLEVANFTLRQPTTPAATTAVTLTLEFVPNANNTPVILRATGSVTIGASTVLSVVGNTGGTRPGTFAPGVGGNGGPGGYRGGNGGLGGLVPTAAAAGLGPGGGPGGAIGASPATAARFLTTGTTTGGTAIPAGNDLLTMLRGGSGGGGSGGTTTVSGHGGGGGAGAILITATNTVTVSGTVTAEGGDGVGGCFSPRTAGGSGGMVRIVATTIAGGGVLSAAGGSGCASPVGGNGIIRLEAVFIPYTGTFAGVVPTVSNTPGVILLPSTPTAFIRFAQLTESTNPSNTVPVPSPTQATPGRTGFITSPDVTMLNPGGVAATSVSVELTVGPNTIATPFPAGKTATLVVAPLDPGQGGAVPYTAAITCVSLGTDCTATVTGVALPLGLSSMSAFTVVNLLTDGQLARMFPKTYQGEPIEQVRIQTSGKETEYVLIARSGKEFPYQPGR